MTPTTDHTTKTAPSNDQHVCPWGDIVSRGARGLDARERGGVVGVEGCW